MATKIDALISALQAHTVGADSFNPYADATRRANLRRYLLAMAERQPPAMMVMEAPGYRGCRLTGIPVTSRKIMLEGVPELGLFGETQGYADVRDAGFDDVYGEQSATIVWGTLAQLGRAPLIWNTYPFHPHKPDAPRTNRKPRKRDDITPALPYVQTLIDLYQPALVIAVGNVAYDSLTGMGLDAHKVRHPAQGGKNDFVAGMRRLLGA